MIQEAIGFGIAVSELRFWDWFVLVGISFLIAYMSFFSIIFAIALILAIVGWLTGYRLPINLPVKGSGGLSGAAPRSRGVPRATRQKLLRLVGGNAAVAQRLVSDVQTRNPGRNEQWCWEKAIYDIGRDRRA